MGRNEDIQSGTISHADIIRNVNGFDPMGKLQPLRITDKTVTPGLNVVARIAGQIVVTKQDAITIAGQVKGGKTGIKNYCLAASLPEDGIINDPVPEIEFEANTECKAVINIDTEQSKFKQKEHHLAILSRANFKACPSHFYDYNFRQLDIEDFIHATEKILATANKECGGVYLAVIDGVADYSRDPNDTAESNYLVKRFEQLAIEYDCPILLIIHTNPNSDKERGHLGSQLIRKSASVLSVKIENDITVLEPKYLRNAGRGKVPTIQFRYDAEKGYLVSCGVKDEKQEIKRAGLKETLQTAVDQILPPPKSMGYTNIIKALMQALDRSERIAKDRWKDIQNFELVTQGPDGNWRKAV